jgi:hypothetical protein
MRFKSITIPPALLANRALRMACVLTLTAAACCGWMAWLAERAYATNDEPDAADRSVYSQTVKEHYNSRFGVDQPFLPSNAVTDTGEFINPKSFPTAKYCGHCHQEAHAEWRQTAHANSFRAPWYVKNTQYA